MKKIKIAFAMIGADLLLLALARRCEAMAEWYGNRIYPIWLQTLGRVCGWFPGSVVEWLLYALVLTAAIWFGRFLIQIHRRMQGTKQFFLKGMQQAFLFSAVLFTLYTVTCGINYYKMSFTETYGIRREVYTTEELYRACEILVERMNELHDQVRRNETGEMIVSKDARKEAVSAMQSLGESYEKLAGFYPLPKGLAGSWILSVQGLTGVYSPFTVEANYNKEMTGYNQPFTMCHELAHLKGFMQEEEANMIGFLACEQSEDLEFRYSSAMMGWIYCGNELYDRDKEKYQSLSERLPKEAHKDLEANSRFWDEHEGIISEASEKVNDAYLKANRQEAGVESYDQVADLIVQYLMKKETIWK